MERIRRIEFNGILNFRDLGGYESVFGGIVKWGKLYRSDGLNSLTEEDAKTFTKLGIKSIFDYRSRDEVFKKPDPIFPGVENINISAMIIEGGKEINLNMKDILSNKEFVDSIENPLDILGNTYKSIAFGNSAYKKLFEYALNKDKYPILQHCTAGKDRTGVGSALILLALGVPEDKIIEDYMLTDKYIKEFNENFKKRIIEHLSNDRAIEIYDALMGVKRQYIEGFLLTVKDRYDTVDKYLEMEFGISSEKRELLKDILLE